MAEWRECTISEIGTVVGGATPSTKKLENYENGEIAWITPKDLSNFHGRYIERGERNITEIGLKSCSAQLLPPNTILFSSRAPIGYVAIAKNEVCTNQGFKSVIPNKNINPLFLFYLLKYNKEAIENMGSGTTFKEVSGNTMKNILVRIPVSISEQRKIAEILASLDDKIEENERINNNLQQQIHAIYKKHFDDCHCEKLPMSSLIEVRDGTHDSPKSKESGMPLVTSKHLLPYGIDKSSANLISEEDYNKINERSKVNTYDILLSMIGTVGMVSFIIENPVDFAIKNVGLFKTSDCLKMAYYIHCYLLSSSTKRLLEQLLAGSTQKYISLTELRKLPICMPSHKLLEHFNETVTPYYETIITNTNENNSLIQLRSVLLPKLMSGEIDVSGIQL